MDTEREITVVNYITKHFDFLLKKGYKLGPIIQIGKMGGWFVNLESEDVAFRLISDRGAVFLAISPSKEECWIGLDVVIFFITSETELLSPFEGDLFRDEEKQFIRLSQVLSKNFDEINLVFRKDFYSHKDRLITLRKKVDALQLQKFMDKN